MLQLADIGFFLFHTLLVGFNMFGWIWKRTRVWHAVAMGLTSFSWFVMGIYYGWGYCLCTDWQFQIRERLGYEDSATTYIQLLTETFLGFTISRTTSDTWAVSVFGLILLAMAVVWSREWLRRRRAKTSNIATDLE